VHFLQQFGYVTAGAIDSIEALISVHHTGRNSSVTSTAILHCPGDTVSSNNITKRFQVLISLEGIPGTPIFSSSNLFINGFYSYRFILRPVRLGICGWAGAPANEQLQLPPNGCQPEPAPAGCFSSKPNVLLVIEKNQGTPFNQESA